MFTATLFTVAKSGNKPKFQSPDEWIHEMGYLHTRKYYPLIRRKEILTPAITWMNLEDTVLSEIGGHRTKIV